MLRRIADRNSSPTLFTEYDAAQTVYTSQQPERARLSAPVQTEQRLVYRVLGTASMLCARFVRGSTTNISNHSWGTAVDLTIDRQLDTRATTRCNSDCSIAPLFNAQGWYWGAGFSTEDGIHFEAGEALVRGWTSAP